MQLGKRLRPGPHNVPGNGARRTAPAGWGELPPAKPLPHAHRPLRPQGLQQDLTALSDEIGSVDPRAAERMSDLAESLTGSDEGRLRWADVDLRRAFNTEQIALAYAVRNEGGYVPPIVDRVDKIRNVMVLLPIMLTWFALFEASRLYSEYIEANPDEIRKPFLLLWQQGFGGAAGLLTPTFSTVALMDAAIIAAIIGLTFYSHGRRESREEAIQKTATAFQTRLDNLLAEATIALAPDRAGRPAMLARSVERLAERFDLSSQELLTRLKAEHDRIAGIADRREREIADFGVFASGMRAGAEETHRLLLDLRQVSTALQQTLEDFSGEIGASGEQQRSLLKAVGSLERLVDANIQSDSAAARQYVEAVDALANAADRSLAGAEEAAQAGRIATEAVHHISELTASLAESQTRLEQALAQQTESNATLADALRSGQGGATTSARMLADASMALTELRGEFNRIGELSQEQALTLSRILSEQTAIAAGLSEVSRDLSAAGVATSLRQREMNDEAASLIRRLDSLTATLAHISGSLPEGSWGREAVDHRDALDPEDADASRRVTWPRRR